MPAPAHRRRWERALAGVLVAQLSVAIGAVVHHSEPRAGACSVLHKGADAELARALRRDCEAAVPQVTAVWGSDWSRRVVVVLPASLEELDRLVPDGGDLEQVAAVVGGRQRIYVNPVAFARLSPAGRRVVLLHEITHVASRATQTQMPAWLVEGLADYVGFLDAGIPVRTAAAELRAQVLAGRLPASLPTDPQFGGPGASVAYQQSWLAVSVLAKARGQAALVQFYRAVRAGAGVDAALRRVLGLSTAQLTVAWRAQLGGLR